MRSPRLAALAALALSLGLSGCISLEDLHLPNGAIAKSQRTVLAVFASPGPVMTQDDNKAEVAAKLTPGLAYVVQAAQDERDTAASKDLFQYLPVWDPASELYPLVAAELKQSGHPGVFISTAEAGFSDADMARFNKADDILDWRLRYYIQSPDHPLPRNYSTFLGLDDALLFEVNLAYVVVQDDQQNGFPRLSAMSRLYRVNTMHLLWKHEDSVDDKGGQRMIYEFKQDGNDLITKYRRLLPSLAHAVADSYHKELVLAGMASGPLVSTTTSSGWRPYAFGSSPYSVPGSTTVPAGVSPYSTATPGASPAASSNPGAPASGPGSGTGQGWMGGGSPYQPH